MEKQKELDRLTKELVKQMTGKEVEDTQEADYQISYYYLNKAMDYTRCCKSYSDQLCANCLCKPTRKLWFCNECFDNIYSNA
tara:strand:+ start:91 stop:336 length:246 start_codon:yes stop_codon:yes gene_type:complete